LWIVDVVDPISLKDPISFKDQNLRKNRLQRTKKMLTRDDKNKLKANIILL